MTPIKPRHTVPKNFKRSVSGDLIIGGFNIPEWKSIIGRTPFYLYDENIIKLNIEKLKINLPERINLQYALKANPNPSVVAYISNLVKGADVSSHKELLLAISSGINPETISFAGPGKSGVELKSAISSGVILHVESINELERIKQLSKLYDTKPQIALRVNLNFKILNSGVRMGGDASPFGIDEEEIIEILNSFPLDKLHFKGFHFYSASQVLNAQNLIDHYNYLFDFVNAMQVHLPSDLEYLNIGGGFGIPYFPGEKELDIAVIGQHLDKLLAENTDLLKCCAINMEFGRYIVGNAGIYVTSVIDKKISKGKTLLIVDGGLHHHLANSGNFGQVIRKNYYLEAVTASEVQYNEKEDVTICGPLCTPLDVVGANYTLPTLIQGDYVIIFNSGAYGLSASPKDFLSHRHPDEVLA